MKTIIIYQSKYGTTKQYAQWIAEALGAELMERSAVKPAILSGYDLVVYGGGLYAGGISGVELVVENHPKNLVVFTVGLANPIITDYSKILDKNLPLQMRDKVKVFHFRGGINYKNLGIIHKIMMSMMKKMTMNKPAHEQTSEDEEFLETYGKEVNFCDRNAIVPLVEYVKSKGISNET